MSKAKQVFISYATADAQFAHRLADDLQRLGVRVWIAPGSIRPGESWVDAIERGLEESSHVVIVLTPAALESKWVELEKEVAIARERKGRIKVIPLDVKPCEVPPLLNRYQMVPFRPDYHAGLSQLADILGLRFTPPEEEAMPFWRRFPSRAWTPVLDQAALGVSALLLALFSIRALWLRDLLELSEFDVWFEVLCPGMLLTIIGALAGWLTRKLGGQIRWGLIVGVLGTVGSGIGLIADRIGLAPAVLLGTAIGIAMGGGWGLLTRPKRRRWSGAFATIASVVLLIGNGYMSFQPSYWWRQVRMLKGHTESVHSVALSPDEATLASGSADRTVRLWWVPSSLLRTRARIPRLSNRGVPDGSLLHIMRKGQMGDVESVAFSPDGETLASGSSDHTVRLWRVSDGRLLRTLEGQTGSVYSVAFSPNGATLASGSSNGTVQLWRVSDGTLLRTLIGHTGIVWSVAFSLDGGTLASGSLDKTVRLWGVATD